MENIKRKNTKIWRNRRVLITGGVGFVGSWLSLKLLDMGAKVVILDLKKAPVGKAIFVEGDVRNEKLLKSLYTKYDIQTVFHLTAQAIVGEALKKPAETLDINIRGTWQVLESFRKTLGTQGQIVVASSDKAYGEHATLPYKEDFTLLGNNPYDCSKNCADRIAQMYATVYKTPVCITRCGNVFGGGDMHFSRLIPDAIRSFYFKKPFKIRSDGQYKRDYVYIKDIVCAYIRTAEAMIEDNLSGEVFNFGSNDPRKVSDVVNIIAQNMGGHHIEPSILASAQYEIKDQYLDSTKAIKILGWKPYYSFEKGISETIGWYKKFFSQNKDEESHL